MTETAEWDGLKSPAAGWEPLTRPESSDAWGIDKGFANVQAPKLRKGGLKWLSRAYRYWRDGRLTDNLGHLGQSRRVFW